MSFVSIYFTNLLLYTIPKSNTEGIERLECITVFTKVAFKLSGNLHVFCIQLCKDNKKMEM